MIFLLLPGVKVYDAQQGLSTTTYAYSSPKGTKTGKIKSKTSKSYQNSTACGKSLKRCKQWSKKTVSTLKKVRDILNQEKSRWAEIHGTPILDEVNVSHDNEKDEMIISVRIEPKVKNAINSQPITRKYIFKLDKDKSLFKGVDLMLGGGWMGGVGIRPYIGIGVKPFKWMKQPYVKDIGISAITMVYSSGCSIYYTSQKIGPFIANIMIGYNHGLGTTDKYTNKGTWAAGIGAGIRF